MFSELKPLYSGSGGYPIADSGSLQDDSRVLIWEATHMIQQALHGHSMDMERLLQLSNNLSHILEKTRQLYNNTIEECRVMCQRAKYIDKCLLQVEDLVGRYATTREPVVAIDGYTYERDVLMKYIHECVESNSKAYSVKTKEVLTEVVVPNMSLIELVTELKSVRLSEIPHSVPGSPIPYFATSQQHSSWGERESTLLCPIDPCTQDLAVSQQLTERHIDPQSLHVSPAVTATPTATAGTHRPTGGNRFEHDGNKTNASGSKPTLHPCLRVYGFCNFMADCTFAKYPYEACLNHIKGKCRFGQNCKELHVDPRDLHYQNIRSLSSHHGEANNTTSADTKNNNNHHHDTNNFTTVGEEAGTFSENLDGLMSCNNYSKNACNSVEQSSTQRLPQKSEYLNKSVEDVSKGENILRADGEQTTASSESMTIAKSTSLKNEETL